MKKLQLVLALLAMTLGVVAQSGSLPTTPTTLPGTWVRDFSSTINIRSMVKNPLSGTVEYYSNPGAIYMGDVVYAYDGVSNIVRWNGTDYSPEYSFGNDTIAGMLAGTADTIYLSTYRGSTFTFRGYALSSKTSFVVDTPSALCRMIGGNSKKVYYGWQRLWCYDIATHTVTQPTQLQNDDAWTFVQAIIPVGDTLYVAVMNLTGNNIVYRVVDTTWTRVCIFTIGIQTMAVSHNKLYMRGMDKIGTVTANFSIDAGSTAIYDLATGEVDQTTAGGGWWLMQIGTDVVLQQSMGTALYKYQDATGITDIAHDALAASYPNPCNNELHVSNAATLINLMGQTVASSETSTILNTSNLSEGMYILNYRDYSQQKIVVRH